MKFFLLLVFFSVSLFARDNPFSDVVTTETFPVSTNIPKTLTRLKKEEFSLPDTARVLKKITIEYQNLDGSVHTLITGIDKTVDWHKPLILTHSHRSSSSKYFKERVKLPFIRFSTKGYKMKVSTKDKLIRHFMLPKPHRIVMDFKGTSHFLAKKFTQFSKPFKKIRLGNHNGFYRVVVELDGQYEYQEKSDNSGITLSVR